MSGKLGILSPSCPPKETQIREASPKHDKAPETPPHVILTGEMGVGKTTLGEGLARALHRPFLDSDVVIEGNLSEPGSVIAVRDGVSALHAIELETFLDMTASAVPSVIAPAASVIDDEAARRVLARNLTVWLVAPDDVLERRQEDASHRRRVDRSERERLRAQRSRLFESVAIFRLDTAAEPAENLVEVLAERLRQVDAEK